MTKLCGNKECRRAGKKLLLSEFPRNKRRKDGRHSYCCECSARQVKRSRWAIKAAREARRKFEVERKPIILAKAKDPFVKVYWSIVKGCKTRQEIKRETKLHYDTIGKVLAELIWECKAVVIVNREFHLAGTGECKPNEQSIPLIEFAMCLGPRAKGVAA